MSVDGIILWLLAWLVNYIAILLVVCQLIYLAYITISNVDTEAKDRDLCPH